MSIASTQVPRAKEKRVKGIRGAKPKITLDQAETMVLSELEGKSKEENTKLTGVDVSLTNRYLGMSLPDEFPDMSQPDWLEQATTQIKHFMAVATWKATRRLATTIDEVSPDRLPLATAIIIDKFSLLTGNPTSLAVVQHQTVTHGDVLSRMKQARAASTAIDSK